jgi:hypothetical protein
MHGAGRRSHEGVGSNSKVGLNQTPLARRDQRMVVTMSRRVSTTIRAAVPQAIKL